MQPEQRDLHGERHGQLRRDESGERSAQRQHFPGRVTTVTNTAADASGNQSSCTFTVTVTDTQNPVITCSSNLCSQRTRAVAVAAT